MKCKRWIDQHDTNVGQKKTIWISAKNWTHDPLKMVGFSIHWSWAMRTDREQGHLTQFICDITKLKIGPLHIPVTWYRINYAGTQVTQWDFQNKGTRTSPVWLSFVLKVPPCTLRPSIINSIPCDGIVQRTYSPSLFTYHYSRWLWQCWSMSFWSNHLSNK